MLQKLRFFIFQINIKQALLLGGFFMLLIGIGAGVYLSQSRQQVRQFAQGSSPIDGNAIYDDCGSGSQCYAHLDTFRDMGIKVVLDYFPFAWGVHMSNILAYAQHAQQDNLKIIWSFKDFYNRLSGSPSQSIYSSLTADCGCNDWVSLATYLTNQLKNNPATWGYYLIDEPKNQSLSASAIAPLSNAVHNADPNHPRLMINNDSLDNANPSSSVNLSNYVSIADVLGEDYYPVSYGKDINKTALIANEVYYITHYYGKQGAMVLELNSGINNILPNQAQMQNMYNQVFTYGTPRLVLWYWAHNTPPDHMASLSKIIGGPPPTPTPTATPTPLPSPTPSPSPVVTSKPSQVVSPTVNIDFPPTINGIISQTSSSGNTTVQLVLGLHDIGSTGDLVNLSGGGNMNPHHRVRNVSVSMYQGNMRLVKVTTTVTFSPTSGLFLGTVNMGKLASGTYTMFLFTPGFLKKKVANVVVKESSANIMSTTYLVNGDINSDNSLDILDYNLLISCFGNRQFSNSCLNPQKSDINDDGVVDGIDYIMFLREFINQPGRTGDIEP